MKNFSKYLILLIFTACSNSNIDDSNIDDSNIDDSINNLLISTNNNIFLDQIRSGLDSIGNDKIKLLSYDKLYSIDSEEKKRDLISNILEEENFLFFSYDPKDIALKDLNFKTYKSIQKQQNFSRIDSKNLQQIMPKNRNLLKEIIKVNHSVYGVKWEINGQKLISYAVFNDKEFVYDNLISNILVYDIKNIESSKTDKVLRQKSDSQVKTYNIGGKSIHAYFMGGVDRGSAHLTSTVTYEVTFLAGGTGQSYCMIDILGVNTDASWNMTWGHGDARYKEQGNTTGTNANGKIIYGMYLTTVGVSAGMHWNALDGQFTINTSDFSSTVMARGDYGVYTSTLPCN